MMTYLKFFGGYNLSMLTDKLNLSKQEEENNCMCCLGECNTYFICKKNSCKNLLCINCKDKIIENYNKCFVCKSKII